MLPGFLLRAFTPPHQDARAQRLSGLCHLFANATQPQDTQGASVQLSSQRTLPNTGIHVRGLRDQVTQARQYHQQGEFGRRLRRHIGFKHRDATGLTRRHIQMTPHLAGLSNHLQVRQTRQQRFPHIRALANKHQGLHTLEQTGQLDRITDMLVQHDHVVPLHLGKTVQGFHAILKIIKHGNFHPGILIGVIWPAHCP